MEVFVCVCMHAKSLQLCLILCNAMDSSLLGSLVHMILQARILELLPPPGDLPDPGIKSVSLTNPALAGGFFTTSTTIIYSNYIDIIFLSILY